MILERGKKYQHRKGGVYLLVDFATHTETEETLVIYKDEKGRNWARPIEMFVDGRFTPIG